MFRLLKCAIYCLSAFLMLSCRTSGVMRDVKVQLAEPDFVLSLNPDTTFTFPFSEVLNPVRIQVVADSLLVIQEPVSSANDSHFRVYSLDTFDYIGSMARNGRGPGEVISPYMVNCPNRKYLQILHHQTDEVYSVDVSETIETGKMVVSHIIKLPLGTIDCVPLADSKCLFLLSENGRLSLRTVADDGETENTFHYSEGLDNEKFITHLSSLFVGNSQNGDVAEIMMFFPLVNILDTQRGNVKSVAVDETWRDWQSVTGSMIGMETIQHYVSATASQDYLFAVYKGLPLSELMRGGHGTSIHVFDWGGGFLYDIKVKENIDAVTYDSRTKYLYCIEKSEGRIIRYDFAEVL